jgi:hypothetical protein
VLPAGGTRVEGRLGSRRRGSLRWRQERCVVAIGSEGIALSTAAGAVVHPWSGSPAVSGMAASWAGTLTLRSGGTRQSFSAHSPSALTVALAQVPPDIAGRRWVQSNAGGRRLAAARALIILQSLAWLTVGGLSLLLIRSTAAVTFLLEVAAIGGCGLLSAWRSPSPLALSGMLCLGAVSLGPGLVLCTLGGLLFGQGSPWLALCSLAAGVMSSAAGIFVVWVIGLRGWHRQGRSTLRGRLDGARASALATFTLTLIVACELLIHERPPTLGHLVAGIAVGISALLLCLALIASMKALGARDAIRLLLVTQLVAIAPPVVALIEQRVPAAWAGATVVGLLFLVPALCTARLLPSGEVLTP